MQRYINEAKAITEASKLKTKLRGVVFSIGQSSPYFSYALALYYGGILVAGREMEFQHVITLVFFKHLWVNEHI